VPLAASTIVTACFCAMAFSLTAQATSFGDALSGAVNKETEKINPPETGKPTNGPSSGGQGGNIGDTSKPTPPNSDNPTPPSGTAGDDTSETAEPKPLPGAPVPPSKVSKEEEDCFQKAFAKAMQSTLGPDGKPTKTVTLDEAKLRADCARQGRPATSFDGGITMPQEPTSGSGTPSASDKPQESATSPSQGGGPEIIETGSWPTEPKSDNKRGSGVSNAPTAPVAPARLPTPQAPALITPLTELPSGQTAADAIAYDKQVSAALARLGVTPQAMTNGTPIYKNFSPSVARTHGLDVAGATVAGAFQAGVPAGRVMQELGLTREQMAAMLDKYLESAQTIGDAGVRRKLIDDYLSTTSASAAPASVPQPQVLPKEPAKPKD
jgi:hypothetical protein